MDDDRSGGIDKAEFLKGMRELGVLLTGLLVIPFFSLTGNTFGIPAPGIIAGMLFVMAGLFSFLAIPELGLAIAQGVWGGAAVLVSFLWGSVGPKEVAGKLGSVGGSAAAVALLLLGIVGIIQAQRMAVRLAGSAELAAAGADGDQSALIAKSGGSGSARPPRPALGFFYAMLVGIFGGSILVPLSYVEVSLPLGVCR